MSVSPVSVIADLGWLMVVAPRNSISFSVMVRDRCITPNFQSIFSSSSDFFDIA